MKTDKKIAIIGGALTMPHPQNKLSETEIWTIGRLCDKIDYADVVFEFHKNDVSYWKKLKDFKGIVIGFYPECFPDIDMVKYPFIEVRDFGNCGNSICYMLAYAIRIGVTEIDLYCMPHEGADEYIFEKPHVLYWIGQCEGSGIKVNDYSNLLKRDLFYMKGE